MCMLLGGQRNTREIFVFTRNSNNKFKKNIFTVYKCESKLRCGISILFIFLLIDTVFFLLKIFKICLGSSCLIGGGDAKVLSTKINLPNHTFRHRPLEGWGVGEWLVSLYSWSLSLTAESILVSISCKKCVNSVAL